MNENYFLNDFDSEKDDYINDNSSFIQFSLTKIPFITESSRDEKLNKDIFKNLENPIKIEKRNNFENFQIQLFELSIMSTKHSSELPRFKIEKNEDNHNSKINFDNKSNLYEKLKKKENIIIEINENLKNNIKEKKTKLGRKRKGEKEKEKVNHDKNAEDNMMRKIKPLLLNECNDLLNRSLKDKNLKFLKLSGEISKDLKIKSNIELLDTKIKDLYEKSPISGRFKSKKVNRSEDNKILIKKIIEENKETDTIKILNLTFRELISNISLQLKEKIEDLSTLDINEFKYTTSIKNKELKNYENEKEYRNYINNLGELIINYEKWFLDRKGRKTIKKMKNKLIYKK